MIIPFVPFPLHVALKESKVFERVGNALAKATPSLKIHLYQAKMKFHPKEYASLVILTTIFYFVVLAPMVFIVGFFTGQIDFFLPLVVSTSFSLFVFFYLMRYPQLVATRRMRKLETDLLNALQHILIEIKSGVPLFNSLIGVSEEYGEISEEFKIIVTEINAGLSEIEAFQRASLRNPSLHFRRSLWQLTNAMKAGSDISSAVESIVKNMVAEQIVEIRRYGQELNPFTLMYMLFSVIMPTLGITFLIILSSFSGLNIPEYLFALIVMFLGMFQYFYMGIIKTKRSTMV
jgi:flagellar protein FlaJ